MVLIVSTTPKSVNPNVYKAATNSDKAKAVNITSAKPIIQNRIIAIPIQKKPSATLDKKSSNPTIILIFFHLSIQPTNKCFFY